MRRRAHIEFLGQTTVRITTFAVQRTFNLDRLMGHNINLVTLKIMKTMERMNDFYANVYCGDGTINNPYQLYIYAHNENSMYPSVVAKLNLMDNREETVEVILIDEK